MYKKLTIDTLRVIKRARNWGRQPQDFETVYGTWVLGLFLHERKGYVMKFFLLGLFFSSTSLLNTSLLLLYKESSGKNDNDLLNPILRYDPVSILIWSSLAFSYKSITKQFVIRIERNINMYTLKKVFHYCGLVVIQTGITVVTFLNFFFLLSFLFVFTIIKSLPSENQFFISPWFCFFSNSYSYAIGRKMSSIVM